MSAKWRRRKKYSKEFDVLNSIARKFKKKHPLNTFAKKDLATNKRLFRPLYEASNARRRRKGNMPEPLIDVLEEKNEMIVLVEAVGFKKENVKIRLREQRLILTAETSERRYYKSLNLPKRVIPETLQVTYKNGVLEIRLKKAVEEKTIDKVAG